MKRWRERNPLQTKAYRLVYSAVRNGNLKKQACNCGSVLVEAHHADYEKPLDVLWVCKPCHMKKDKERRKMA